MVFALCSFFVAKNIHEWNGLKIDFWNRNDYNNKDYRQKIIVQNEKGLKEK